MQTDEQDTERTGRGQTARTFSQQACEFYLNDFHCHLRRRDRFDDVFSEAGNFHTVCKITRHLEVHIRCHERCPDFDEGRLKVRLT